jgi:hypothetical protein
MVKLLRIKEIMIDVLKYSCNIFNSVAFLL